MSMQRSDLPHVSKLSRDQQREAVDEMWRAFCRAEHRDDPRRDMACPVSHVATMVEMLEAALAVVQR